MKLWKSATELHEQNLGKEAFGKAGVPQRPPTGRVGGGHKYIRREGGPGGYKYVYEEGQGGGAPKAGMGQGEQTPSRTAAREGVIHHISEASRHAQAGETLNHDPDLQRHHEQISDKQQPKK